MFSFFHFVGLRFVAELVTGRDLGNYESDYYNAYD